MFSNRGFGWKLSGALALVAGLGVLSAWRGNSINPSAWRCLAQPDRWDGTPLRVAGRVHSVSPGAGFSLAVGSVLLPVAGPAPVSRGEHVEVTGTFEGGVAPRLRLADLRRVAPDGAGRGPAVAVSLLVLMLVGANFLRHFSFRPEAARVEATD